MPNTRLQGIPGDLIDVHAINTCSQCKRHVDEGQNRDTTYTGSKGIGGFALFNRGPSVLQSGYVEDQANKDIGLSGKLFQAFNLFFKL